MNNEEKENNFEKEIKGTKSLYDYVLRDQIL